jgi:hypothetical protein
MARTVNSLIESVRSILDEVNEANLDDEGDLLPSLNRGYDCALSLLAKHYVAPILAYETVSLTSGTQEYPIPKDAIEDRLLKVEIYNNQAYSEIQRVDYSQITPFDTPSRVNFPYYYTVVGSNYRLLPPPTATYPLRIWYAKHPGTLVQEQGRIEVIGSNYVLVDEVGDSLSPTGMAAYINLVDGETGSIKATMQVQSIIGNKITLKATPDRSSVYGRDTTGTLPTTLAKDDLICSAAGSPIPVLRSTVANFLVQFTVAEMTRKLGGEPTIEEKVKSDFEEYLRKMHHGRETYSRVKKRSREWGTTGRRYFPSNGS